MSLDRTQTLARQQRAPSRIGRGVTGKRRRACAVLHIYMCVKDYRGGGGAEEMCVCSRTWLS